MVYSYSQVQTYIQCPLKYRYKYIDKLKIKDFIETADMILGKIVHKSLELLYKDVNNFQIPNFDKVLQQYYDLRTEKENEAKQQNGKILIIGDKTLDDYKNRGKYYLEAYYEKHSPFQDIKVIDTELEFVFNLNDELKFRGIIDRIDKVGDSFIISDYKTNKRLPPEDKDNLIEQLTLYGIGIKQKYGKYYNNLKARLYLLHFDIEDERDLIQDNMDKVLTKYINIIEEIEKKKLKYNGGDKKIFEPQTTKLCPYCDFQSICPLFNPINTDDEVVSELSEHTLTSLVDEFVEISDKMSELKNQQEGLKEIFRQYVELKDSEDNKPAVLISGTSKNVKVTKKAKFTVLNKETFKKKLQELGFFDEYAEITYHTVDKLFGKLDKLDIQDFENIVSESTGYDIRKTKKK